MLAITGVDRRFACFPLSKYSTRLYNPFFDNKNALSRQEPNGIPLKICLKNVANTYFIVIEYKEFLFDEATVRNQLKFPQS